MVALHALLDDDEYSVRAEALLAVSVARKAASIPVLIARLDLLSGTEQERTASELRLLTGEDYGDTTSRWANWWTDHGAGFTVPPIEEAAKAESEREERRASNQTQSRFYGLGVSSERVCFVVDLSGSMNFRTKSGKTRLEALKSELDRFLQAFPSGHLFNLIFFGNGAEKWRPQLALMNEQARSEATEHVRSLEAPGATAIYDGLVAAFEDPRVDTIYLLTDGGPSGGTIDDIDEIVAEVRRWNSLRHLVIHSVAVGRKSRLLETLSADSGGDYAVVN
jgi:Mg-chelatase subunit ChlD